MAQDNLDALTDAVMQAESRGRRFGSDAKKLLESVKGAQGEMQVMPKTQMKPGYGVEPAKDKSGEEIARVGRDYLKAMVGKYGDQVHALAAYNWGPGNTDKWVAAGADMSKLPAETRKYIQEVQSNLQSRLAQQGPSKAAEPTESEKVMEPALRSGMSAQAPTQSPASSQTILAQLGPNYQAALALNTIAEQDEKDAEDEGDKLDDWQRDKELENEIEGGTAKRALAALEGLSFQSPVAGEQQPVRMAAGGAIQLTPIAALNPAKKAEIGVAKADWDKYNANATAYNDALTKYKTEKYDPYVKQVEAYNAAITSLPTGPGSFKQVSQMGFQGQLPAVPVVPEFNMVAPEQPKVEAAKVQAMAKAAAQDRNSRQAALDAAGNPEAYGLTINRIGFAEGGEADKDSRRLPEMSEKSDVDFIRSAHKMQMGDKELQSALLGLGMDGALVGATLSNMKQGDKDQLARSLMAAYNTKVGDVGVNASVMRPMNSHDEPEMYMGNIGASVPVGQGRLMLNAMGMQTPQESRSTGHSIGYERQIGPGTFSASMMQPRDNPDGRSYQLQYRMPVGRAEGSPMGGENADHMTPQEIERMAAAQQPAFMTPGSGRGRTAGPISQTLKSGDAYIAAAKGVTELPYDIAGAPVDLVTMAMRPFGYSTEKPVMGSDWIKEKMTALNVRPEPPADPTLKGFYTIGELGSNLVNPAAVVRGAVKVAEKTGQAVSSKAAEMMNKFKGPKRDPEYVQYLMGGAHDRPLPDVPPAVQTELAQLTANRQAPRAGQLPDPLMGVAPTLDEAGANVAARQEAGLPPPLPAAPPAMPEVTPVAPPMQAKVSPERPFAGRLDAFVDTLQGPVQLGQLKGQLKGKFRDYDLERVERAFAGMEDKTKLTPDQIKQALSGVHAPSNWVSETLPPKVGAYHQNQDNVWAAPLGTTNLYLNQPPEKIAANDLLKKAAQVFNPFMKKTTDSTVTTESLEKARTLLTDPELIKVVDPELISNLSKTLDKVEKNVGLVGKYENVIKNVQNGFEFPILYTDATVASAKYSHQPFFKFEEEAKAAAKESLIQKFIAQGSDVQAARALAAKELSDNFYLYHGQAQKAASLKVQELAIAEAQKHGIDIPDVSLVKWDELRDASRPMGGNTAFKESVANALEPSRVTVHNAIKNIRNVLDPEIKKVGDILYKQGNLYEGKHRGVAGKPYPIGFTRFSEHEAIIPGMGPVQGRHFHELQSDLSRDMRQSGTTSGSLAKDQAEYNKLQGELRQEQQKAMDKLQELQAQKRALTQDGGFSPADLTRIEEEEKAARKALDKGTQAMEKRISILGARIRDKASYSLEEPFAGFETNQMVRQQLLMKNAIQSAMREGKSFATFPGNESLFPNLYVGKVQPNLKQVIKDLGGEKSGLELRQIELPPTTVEITRRNGTVTHPLGTPVSAWGVVWSPEAAARIMKTGVPFAKGGSVEKSNTDHRAYI